MKCWGFAFVGCLLAIGSAHAAPPIEQIDVRGNHRIEAEAIRHLPRCYRGGDGMGLINNLRRAGKVAEGGGECGFPGKQVKTSCTARAL